MILLILPGSLVLLLYAPRTFLSRFLDKRGIDTQKDSFNLVLGECVLVVRAIREMMSDIVDYLQHVVVVPLDDLSPRLWGALTVLWSGALLHHPVTAA